ncbi:MAG: DNA polymerase III subunit chi [Gammaproteobacteria bacterium]|nr:DNA polymerase III subunit chi [Gammaproteobacteria bacterium]
MTQIDFYIVAENSPRDINQMVCRLCEKALSQKMSVLIYTKSTAQAQQLDDLLWTFKADSFIAHHNLSSESEHSDTGPQSEFNYPILISSTDRFSDVQNHEHYTQLLINLTSETPSIYQQFERLAEMVDKTPHARETARNRYRFYRQQGYSLNKYDL